MVRPSEIVSVPVAPCQGDAAFRGLRFVAGLLTKVSFPFAASEGVLSPNPAGVAAPTGRRGSAEGESPSAGVQGVSP